MLKKLLSLGALALAFNATVAQTNLVTSGKMPGPESQKLVSQTAPTNVANKIETTTVADTLWYFFNKYKYKTPTANQGFYTVKNPYPNAAVHDGYFGSTFLNTSTVTVNGMFFLAGRLASSPSPSIAVRAYLCNATPAGVPVLPPVDSLTTVVTGTTGMFAGGSLTTSRTMTTNFSILYKNISPSTSDTLLAFMSKTTPTTGIVFSEGLSYLRVNGTFSLTTAFGADYEFQVIPTVSFPITASATASAPSSTCVPTTYTFTNNSNTAILGNRQFNLNKFLAKWQPFANTAPTGDSIFVWNPGDGSGNVNNMPTMDVHTYTTAGTYTGSLTANYQLQAANGQKKMDVSSGPTTINSCGPTGINELNAAELLVFPNPSNGVVNVRNMGYNSTLELFNLLGESVYKEKVTEDSKTVDMSRLPAGNYYLKITSAEGRSTIKKLYFN